MGALFNLDDHRDTDGINLNAVRLAGELGYPGLIPPLVEMTRFVGDRPIALAVGTALNALTGETLAGDDFFGWYAWLGTRPEIDPAPGYASWKGRLYSYFDQRFHRFLNDSLPARIPLAGVQWGGVTIDGIPPLEHPSFIPAAEAGYLSEDETVFGVSINGDSRAYPHRIMNWHEMANDTVGGRPVTLVY
jgi:hypothetical protein